MIRFPKGDCKTPGFNAWGETPEEEKQRLSERTTCVRCEGQMESAPRSTNRSDVGSDAWMQARGFRRMTAKEVKAHKHLFRCGDTGTRK